ncbi:MAG TPA: bifunctional histidinol-phosphatase/imidazoleglycerol-phosphate dehydratase HisB [Gammaproteobacteria bacterium]|nr:bifunctional histidinol-phosphatase/imidazoleglycerol-phosphate dehydratase HisB [Gammaproteobacteria bacterium]
MSLDIKRKILFIDRDGTLINEPEDFQIDSIEKLVFLQDVFDSLLKLKKAGFSFVMVSNQDGLGTPSLPLDNFNPPHELMLRIFESQGIVFESVRICPHKSVDNCDCRKPKIGLLLDYLRDQTIDRDNSYVIGDRETDIQLAQNLGITGIKYNNNWLEITRSILEKPRTATIIRKTKETAITVELDLDGPGEIFINTGIGFFDHMLEQLAKHGDFGLTVKVEGDLHIDDHHTVEDTAITIGEALKKALGDKLGIGRYGFLLPMDEALVQVALDLSGRSYLVFNANFARESVGDLSTELVQHFFRSFSEGLKANLHIEVKGENTHHMIESVFKGVGRTLRQAIEKRGDTLPSTKGVL